MSSKKRAKRVRRRSRQQPPAAEPAKAAAVEPASPAVEVEQGPTPAETFSTGVDQGSRADQGTADADELARIAADVARQEAERTAKAGAQEQVLSVADQAEAKERALLDAAERMGDGDVSLVAAMSAEELGELFQLGFGLWGDHRAMQGLRADYWELPDKSAKRLGNFLKKSIAIHGLAWIEKLLPDIMLVGFTFYEIQARRRKDYELAVLDAATKGGASA